jgi:hypothetical protein
MSLGCLIFVAGLSTGVRGQGPMPHATVQSPGRKLHQAGYPNHNSFTSGEHVECLQYLYHCASDTVETDLVLIHVMRCSLGGREMDTWGP